MTYTILELQRFTCDKCGEKEEQAVNPDMSNLIEMEQDLIAHIQSEGWTYTGTKEHLCPDCSKLQVQNDG